MSFLSKMKHLKNMMSGKQLIFMDSPNHTLCDVAVVPIAFQSVVPSI